MIYFLLSMLLLSCAEATEAKLRMAVCFTGQAARFTTPQNKIANFLRPASESWIIDLFLVLSNSSEWTNQQRIDGVSQHHGTPQSIFDTMQKLAGSSVNSLRMNDSEQEQTANIDPIYLRHLDKPFFTPAQRQRRALNHFRQFSAIEKCWKLIRTFNASTKYDLYARLRDDVYFFRPWKPPIEWAFSADLHVPACLSSQGYNDKIAFMSEAVARQYFPILLSTFRDNGIAAFLKKRERIHNPETFFRAVMSEQNVTVRQECAAALPLAPVTEKQNGICFRRKDVAMVGTPKMLKAVATRAVKSYHFSCFFDTKESDFSCVEASLRPFVRQHLCIEKKRP